MQPLGMRGRAEAGPAEEPRGQPGLGPPGLRAPRAGCGRGSGGGRVLLQSGLAVGAGGAEGRGRAVRRGLSASEGGDESPRAPGGLGGRGLARGAGEGRAGPRRWRNRRPSEAKFEKKDAVPAIFQA